MATTKATFEELKAKYSDAVYLVELGKKEGAFLKIEDINGPTHDEKLKVAFHMIKSPLYALANADKTIISEVSLNKADMTTILQGAQVQREMDKQKISDLESKLAAYEAANGGSNAVGSTVDTGAGAVATNTAGDGGAGNGEQATKKEEVKKTTAKEKASANKTGN